MQMFSKFINKALYILLATIISVACSAGLEEPLHYGELSVSLSGEPEVEVLSRASVALDPAATEAAGYMVYIYNSSDEEQYRSSYAGFEAQRLPLGTYYVTAENCTLADAESGNGKMRLYGRSNDITLSLDNLAQTAEVNCTVANAKVCVQFDESVKDRFTDLKVILTGGTTSGRMLTIPETATGVVTETWFNPSELTYSISGTFIAGGLNKDVNIVRTIELQARNNIKLVVKVNVDNGQLMPQLNIDTQIDDTKEVSGEFNPYK